MAALNMPAAEHVIDAQLVRSLLEAQHPDLVALVIRPLGEGWDNAVFRLGDELVVRLPRREAAASLIENEIRWVSTFACRLPLPVSVAERVGKPGFGYPWSWFVSKWLPGEVAAVRAPRDPDLAAEALGAFLAALHEPASPEAPRNRFRGIPLAARAQLVDEHLEQLSDELGKQTCSRLRSLWNELLQVPAYIDAPRWLHGDLHPANVLVHEGAIAGVLDFGDVCAGDPATDLALAWMLLPETSHENLRRAYGKRHDDAIWLRAEAWALALGLAAIAGAKDKPVIQSMGRQTLRNVLRATEA